MSDCLIHLTEKEFGKHSYPLNASFIDFKGNSFSKGFTFSLGMQEQAIKFCQKLAAKKIKSLLVKGKHGITIWIQTKGDNSEGINPKYHLPTTEKEVTKQSYDESTNITSSNAELNNSQENRTNKVPTKKVTRVYRGQTYEVEIPDYSTIQEIPNQQKPRIKYRGQYVD